MLDADFGASLFASTFGEQELETTQCNLKDKMCLKQVVKGIHHKSKRAEVRKADE
jgi:hypothetical protein